ncbi:hypothetical protein [Tamaricihabitans halophyticus]|uniref:hypothetical protein n=1 Tax=Tamaricihabitans halophyticus TaxID=1262583 RepID=UPI001049B33D|nr:hypothetical protein [Tamaricihabitans halophyticus]
MIDRAPVVASQHWIEADLAYLKERGHAQSQQDSQGTRSPGIAGEPARVAGWLRAVEHRDYTGAQALRCLAVRWLVGILGGLVLGLFLFGVLVTVAMLLPHESSRPHDRPRHDIPRAS